MYGKMKYSINWITGRYKLEVFYLPKSKTVPVSVGFGKCESIHPDIPLGP